MVWEFKAGNNSSNWKQWGTLIWFCINSKIKTSYQTFIENFWQYGNSADSDQAVPK